MGFLKKLGKAVSKPFSDLGGQVGEAIAGGSGRRVGEQIGAIASPGGFLPGSETFSKAAGSITKGLTGSAGLGQAVQGFAGGEGLQTLPGMGTFPQTAVDQLTGGLTPGQAFPEDGSLPVGNNSYNTLARQLAQGYGLALPRGAIVDQAGNFTVTPDQLAKASGLSTEETAMRMNLMAQAVADKKNKEAQGRATAALQAGLGQVRSRAPGSLAAMQSGFYQAMAANYADPNQLDYATDFNYWIQSAQFQQAEARAAREAKARQQAETWGAIGGIAGGLLGGPGGAAIGGSVGKIFSGWF